MLAGNRDLGPPISSLLKIKISQDWLKADLLPL
jgi:hypothetical protein